MNLTHYVPTLVKAVDSALEYISLAGATLESTEAIRSVFAFDGITYGSHKEAHAPLASCAGKPTKKWAHVTIWRLETGTYEWNAYCL